MKASIASFCSLFVLSCHGQVDIFDYMLGDSATYDRSYSEAYDDDSNVRGFRNLPPVESYFNRGDDKNKCDFDRDCPLYHYCLFSLWSGRTCETFFRDEPYLTSCQRRDPITGKLWPDHEICTRRDKPMGDKKYSTSRCYEELGFKCQKSYLMPCTPNFDSRGNEIEGEEKGCPQNFKCEARQWGRDRAEVCVPLEPKMQWALTCETPFDCGYSNRIGGWPSCVDKKCRRTHE